MFIFLTAPSEGRDKALLIPGFSLSKSGAQSIQLKLNNYNTIKWAKKYRK
jgi:hypothetical protein